MGAWADVVIDPSRIRAAKRPPTARRQPPIVEPRVIKTEGLRWVAVRTAQAAERRVADELAGHGYASYCPLGAKFVRWNRGNRPKNPIVKQFPVFARYIFLGLREGQYANKYVPVGKSLAEGENGNYTVVGARMVLIDGIESVLSDSRGPLAIPCKAIAAINTMEMRRRWDETKSPPLLQPGTVIRIKDGVFREFLATVETHDAECRIRALVEIFGRQTVAHLDEDDVEVVGA
jgi:hypothetical protein